VIELSGRPFSATLPGYASVLPAVQIGLAVPRPDLDQRIAARVRQMWRDGLVDEVRGLAGNGERGTGLRAGLTASRALGYAQVLRFLDGEWSEAEAEEQTAALRGEMFARLQESRFRRDPRIRWLAVYQPVQTDAALAAIAESAAAAD
jgi:tRNA dimethylallyltransferase